MASLRKFPRSPYWYAAFTSPDGRRLQRSTKETSRKAAQAKADQWEGLSKDGVKARQAQRVIADIYRMAHKETLPMSTTRAFFEGWVARRQHEVKKASYVAYEARSRHYLEWLGGKADQPLGEIAAVDVQRYRDTEAKRVAARTVNLGVKILRLIFEDARRDNLIADNPAKDVRTLKVAHDGPSRRPFTPEELRALLGAADDEWRSMILFGLYTGQRLADVAKLKWSNIDVVNDEIRLQTGKTGKVVSLPIAKALANHIGTLTAGDDPQASVHPRSLKLLHNGGGKASTLSRQFSEILINAGLLEARTHEKGGDGRDSRRRTSEISFHSLRHTATSLMKNAGMSSAVVQDIIGHNSAEMNAHYTHIENAAKRKALDSMPDVTG